MWEPKDCCCCCSRKTGCLVVGGLGVAFALLTLISDLHAISTVSVADITDGICNDPKFENFENCQRIVPNIVMAIFIGHFVGAVICLTVYSMLIHGVNKKIPCLMVPSMVMLLIKIILGCLIGVLILGLLVSGLPGKEAEVPFVFISAVLFLAIFLSTYILLVLRSHYREIRCDNAEDHRVLIEEPLPEKELQGKGYNY